MQQTKEKCVKHKNEFLFALLCSECLGEGEVEIGNDESSVYWKKCPACDDVTILFCIECQAENEGKYGLDTY
jgi:predicted RNA-binding Zn-ribbon protein involved in translation (DUF1610 family)